MVDLSRIMQDAAILEVIDKSADEASNLSAQNSYQAMRIEELERDLAAAQEARQRAEADAESNRKDAERYRWLRGNGAIISRAAGIPVHLAHFGIGLDAAIDAAKGKP